MEEGRERGGREGGREVVSEGERREGGSVGGGE